MKSRNKGKRGVKRGKSSNRIFGAFAEGEAGMDLEGLGYKIIEAESVTAE